MQRTKSFFNPRLRDLAAQRYTDAREAQRIAQYHRTMRACVIICLALALVALGLAVRDTLPPLAFTLTLAGTVLIYGAILLA